MVRKTGPLCVGRRLQARRPVLFRGVRVDLASLAFVALMLAAGTWSRPALAYRPFDGTDADVAEEGIFELELGPIGYYRQSGDDSLVLPSLVLNQGIADDIELVLQTNRFEALGAAAPGQPRVAYLDTAFLMKHVWLDGELQDAEGPSIATEAGPLFPTGPDQHGVGAILTTIMSVVAPMATFHFNVAPSLTVQHDFDLFISTIVEGPHEWTVRPAAEVYVDHDFGLGTTYSGLLGIIWRAREGLEFDLGARRADMAGQAVIEGRLGVTWALQLWSDKVPRVEGPPQFIPGMASR